jgi:LSD1 subclass zinc finger protein
MNEAPRPPRRVETYELTCWKCRRPLEIAVNTKPYRCSFCGVPLLIQWSSAHAPSTQPAHGKSRLRPPTGTN